MPGSFLTNFRDGIRRRWESQSEPEGAAGRRGWIWGWAGARMGAGNGGGEISALRRTFPLRDCD